MLVYSYVSHRSAWNTSFGAEYANLSHVHINSEYCVITIRIPVIPPNEVFHAERCETYE